MTPDTIHQPERISSHVLGLDTLLGGGFFRSGVYIIEGPPGSGKTILANQLCFGHAAQGGRAVYVTLLAESHIRMLQHLSGMSFFDESAIPDRVTYLSAFQELEEEGLKGLMTVVRREMRATTPAVLVIDGLMAASESADSALELKKFIHEMQTSAVFHACTVFFLTSGRSERTSPEHTMADGLIGLNDALHGYRSERTIQVHKFRGSRSLRGQHSFRIEDTGLTVYPRIESRFRDAPRMSPPAEPLSTGVPSLDVALGRGGLPEGSATVIVGSAGIGKTTLALHFLSQATAEEPGLFFGFFETPERLRARGRSLGIDLEGLERAGGLTLVWQAQDEQVLDELGHQLLAEVARLGARRVVIDGLGGFFEAAIHTERIGRYFSCLVNELRNRGATVLMTLETRDAVTSYVPTPYGISAIVDNLIFLRYTEVAGELKRLTSILKVRGCAFDTAVRELTISSDGVAINGRFSAPSDTVPSAVPVSKEPGGDEAQRESSEKRDPS